MDRFERLTAFWNTQNYKKYVVTLEDPRGRKPRETTYIRLSFAVDCHTARHLAKLHAVDNSPYYSRASVRASARLAHPVSDLGCTWGGPGPAPV